MLQIGEHLGAWAKSLGLAREASPGQDAELPWEQLFAGITARTPPFMPAISMTSWKLFIAADHTGQLFRKKRGGSFLESGLEHELTISLGAHLGMARF